MRGRGVAAGLVAAVLSLVIVAGPAAGPASALAPEQMRVTQMLRTVPKAAIGVSGAACATGLGCAAVGAIMLGMLAYETKDAWLPWLGLNDGTETDQGGRSTGQCQVDWISGPTVLPSGQIEATAQHGMYCWQSWSSTSISGTLGARSWRCIRTVASGTEPAGTVYSSTAGDTWQTVPTTSGSPGGPAVGSYVVGHGCPAGTAPYSAVLRVTNQYGGSTSVLVNYPVAPELWSNTATVQCQRPDGTLFTISGSEVGHPERLSIPSCAAADSTSVPVDVTVTGPGGEPLVDMDLPTFDSTPYPDCFGPSGLLCQIKVYVDGLPCVPGMAGCSYWWSHRDDPAWVPERIECRFGSHVVPLSDCEPLKRSYRPDAPPEGDPLTDPNGVPEPDPEPDPSASPSPSPGTDGFPSTGTNPGTAPGTSTEVNPDSASCFGAGWSWNPVSWVYIPVKCALIWAFVPKSPPALDFASPLPAGWLPDIPTLSNGTCGTITLPAVTLGAGRVKQSYGPTTLVDTCENPWPWVRGVTYYGVLAMVTISAGFRAMHMVMNGLGLAVDADSAYTGYVISQADRA